MARKYFGLKSATDFIKDGDESKLVHDKSYIRLYNISNHPDVIYKDWVEYDQYTVYCTQLTTPIPYRIVHCAFESQYKVHDVKYLNQKREMAKTLIDLRNAPIDETNGSLPIDPEFDPSKIQIPEGYPVDLPKGTLCNYCDEEIKYDPVTRKGIPIYKVEGYNQKRNKSYMDYSYPFCSYSHLATFVFETTYLLKPKWNILDNCFAFGEKYFGLNRRKVHIKTKFILKKYNSRGLFHSWGEYESRTRDTECTIRKAPYQFHTVEVNIYFLYHIFDKLQIRSWIFLKEQRILHHTK